jgi:hypothetical protein
MYRDRLLILGGRSMGFRGFKSAQFEMPLQIRGMFGRAPSIKTNIGPMLTKSPGTTQGATHSVRAFTKSSEIPMGIKGEMNFKNAFEGPNSCDWNSDWKKVAKTKTGRLTKWVATNQSGQARELLTDAVTRVWIRQFFWTNFFCQS